MELQIDGDGLVVPLPPGSAREEVADERSMDRMAHRRLYGWIDALAKRGLGMEIDLKPGRTILHLRGRLDRQSALVLKDGFREIVAQTSKSIDVDLVGVDRVDGLGLAALVWSWRLALDSGLELRLTRMRPDVRAIVTKMNLHHLLQIVEDRGPLHIPE